MRFYEYVDPSKILGEHHSDEVYVLVLAEGTGLEYDLLKAIADFYCSRQGFDRVNILFPRHRSSPLRPPPVRTTHCLRVLKEVSAYRQLLVELHRVGLIDKFKVLVVADLEHVPSQALSNTAQFVQNVLTTQYGMSLRTINSLSNKLHVLEIDPGIGAFVKTIVYFSGIQKNLEEELCQLMNALKGQTICDPAKAAQDKRYFTQLVVEHFRSVREFIRRAAGSNILKQTLPDLVNMVYLLRDC